MEAQMLVRLHSQATTTPKVRAEIQASVEPAWVLAERHGTTEQTIYKWRHRDSVEDRSHTPHRLQTTLTPAQEAVAVALRRTLLVSLDDLLAVMHEFINPNVSRSGLDRCLRRYGVGNLRECHEVCVSGLAHAGFRYAHALKRSSNRIANWFLAANHSLTFLPPFSKLRIAR